MGNAALDSQTKPMAWMTRPSSRIATEGEAATRAEPMVNNPIPPAKTRSRPNRSAIHPAGTSSAAEVTENPVSAHDTRIGWAWNVSLILLKATNITE